MRHTSVLSGNRNALNSGENNEASNDNAAEERRHFRRRRGSCRNGLGMSEII